MLLRTLRIYLRPYKREMAIVVVLQLVGTIASLYLPSLNADIIDNGVVNGDTDYIIRVGAVMLGISIVRYRLFDVDLLISRTLVYGVLTLLLVAAYVVLVLAGQAVFSSFAGGSNLAIAASTLVVAALFLPLRSRVQRVVDRRFNRRRYDAQRTLDAFGSRLREQVDLETLAGDLRRAVDSTIQPAHVSLWLRSGGGS